MRKLLQVPWLCHTTGRFPKRTRPRIGKIPNTNSIRLKKWTALSPRFFTRSGRKIRHSVTTSRRQTIAEQYCVWQQEGSRNEQVSCKFGARRMATLLHPNTEFNYAKQTIFVMGMVQARIGLIPYPALPSTSPTRHTCDN